MKRIDHLNFQRGLSRRAALSWLIVLGAAGVGGYFFFPSGNPTAPRLTSPADQASLQAQSPSTGVLLKWEQGGTRTLRNKQPRWASHFVICLTKGTPGSDCGGNGTDTPYYRQVLPAGELTRRRVEGAGLYEMLWATINPAWAYEHRVSIPDTIVPGDFHWNVAACAGPALAGCTFNSPGRRFSIWVPDINIVHNDLDDNSIPGSNPYSIQVTMEIENNGTTDSGPFEVATQVWQIRANPSNNPETNPSQRQAGDLFLFADGSTRSSLTGVDPATVRGITIGSSPYLTWTRNYGNLAAGDSRIGEHPCGSPPCVIQPPAGVGSGGFALFAIASQADPANAVDETDETDNTEYKGRVRMFVP